MKIFEDFLKKVLKIFRKFFQTFLIFFNFVEYFLEFFKNLKKSFDNFFSIFEKCPPPEESWIRPCHRLQFSKKNNFNPNSVSDSHQVSYVKPYICFTVPIASDTK